MLLQSVLKWAIASLVVISPLVIAILPTVSLKLSKTVLSGTTLMLKRFTASCVNRSELFRIYKPQDPISEIETQVTSSGLLLNHCDSFRGGVLPIEISKNSSAILVHCCYTLELNTAFLCKRYCLLFAEF